MLYNITRKIWPLLEKNEYEVLTRMYLVAKCQKKKKVSLEFHKLGPHISLSIYNHAVKKSGHLFTHISPNFIGHPVFLFHSVCTSSLICLSLSLCLLSMC